MSSRLTLFSLSLLLAVQACGAALRLSDPAFVGLVGATNEPASPEGFTFTNWTTTLACSTETGETNFTVYVTNLTASGGTWSLDILGSSFSSVALKYFGMPTSGDDFLIWAEILDSGDSFLAEITDYVSTVTPWLGYQTASISATTRVTVRVTSTDNFVYTGMTDLDMTLVISVSP